MTRYELVQTALRETPKTWLVTGVAGFIGSNLLETLLKTQSARGRAGQLCHRPPAQFGRSSVAGKPQSNGLTSTSSRETSVNPEDCRHAMNFSGANGNEVPTAVGLRAASGRSGQCSAICRKSERHQRNQHFWVPQHAGRVSRCEGLSASSMRPPVPPMETIPDSLKWKTRLASRCHHMR